MKRLWGFFSSLYLTVSVAIAICMVAAYGSIAVIREGEFYSSLDMQILFPWLLGRGLKDLGLTAWVFILVFLAFIFTVNTVVCTTDALISVAKGRKPAKSIFPHIVHIGFVVAIAGHLIGSSFGFKTSDNVVFKDKPTPVPNNPGLFVRLEAIDMKTTAMGDIDSLATKVTLLRDGAEIHSGAISLNKPLIYKGIAFYHANQGMAPTGLMLDVQGEMVEAGFKGYLKTERSGTFLVNGVYPDFALDEKGNAYSRSDGFRNPHLEIISTGGERAYLNLSAEGSYALIAGKRVSLVDYIMAEYAVLIINKDPGIYLIAAGSFILTAGMLLLLVFKGEKRELARRQ